MGLGDFAQLLANPADVIAALLTLEPEAFARWASEDGREGAVLADLVEDAALRAALQPAIDAANALVSRAESIRAFAASVNDSNPLHHDEAVAARSRFGGLIASGTHSASLLMALTAAHFSRQAQPLGLEFKLHFHKAVHAGDTLQLAMNNTDYQTARSVAQAINQAKGPGTAVAVDARMVRVSMPAQPEMRVGFMADIENLPVTLAKPAAKVILNARTGSVVLNEAVTLGACAVAHGNLSVTISTTPTVSQPGPLSGGKTVQAEKNDIAITQQGGQLMHLPAGAKLADVVRALNTLGATPQDLQAILQAMKSAGALNAEIEVI